MKVRAFKYPRKKPLSRKRSAVMRRKKKHFPVVESKKVKPKIKYRSAKTPFGKIKVIKKQKYPTPFGRIDIGV